MPQSHFPELLHRVQVLKREATLLREIDAIQLEILPVLAIAEVKELLDALNQPNVPDQQSQVNGEVMDIIVFYLSFITAIGRHDEVLHVPGYINGIADQSGHLDLLASAIGDLRTDRMEDSSQRATRDEIMRILISMVNHYPNLGPSAVNAMDRTVEKVLSNRDPRFYAAQENGVDLTPEEIHQKYLFLEKFQRAMRDELGRTLRSSDWDQVADLAYQWRKGQPMLTELQLRLRTSVLS